MPTGPVDPADPFIPGDLVRKHSPKYLISACLCGMPCRYDGSSCLVEAIALLVKNGQGVPFCPEQAGGLSTPRAPAEKRGDKVIDNFSQDVTGQHLQGAQKALEFMLAHRLKIAILKDFSPSCGTSMVYDGTFSNTLVCGEGITTHYLRQHGIRVYNTEEYLLGKIIL